MHSRSSTFISTCMLSALLTTQGAVSAQPTPSLESSSPHETKLVDADALLALMDLSRTGVSESLRKARAQRDAIKVPCISDKLTQIDVAIRTARELRDALTIQVHFRIEETGETGSDPGSYMGRLAALQSRVTRLRRDASECIGSTTMRSETGGDGDTGSAKGAETTDKTWFEVEVDIGFCKFKCGGETTTTYPNPPVDPPKPATPIK